MFLQQLHIINFKNHSKVSYVFDNQIIGFTGLNGVGKTNILDALYICGFTKSYFSSSDKQNIKQGEDFFRIEAVIKKETEVFNLAIALQNGKKKFVEINSVKHKKMSEHLGLFPIVIVAPDDNVLILGGSEERRKFVDTILVQVDKDYLSALNAYSKVLQQRNALLKSAKDSKLDKPLLEIYNQQLIPLGSTINEKRKLFIGELEPLFNQCYQSISENKEEFKINYKSSLNEFSFDEQLKNALAKDQILQRTTVGVHKDDLEFVMFNDKVKQYGSQGQQKTFLLALKLSQFHYLKTKLKVAPIFLIDDMFDKLDAERGKRAVQYIQTELSQVFISHTNKGILEEAIGKDNIQIFELE